MNPHTSASSLLGARHSAAGLVAEAALRTADSAAAWAARVAACLAADAAALVCTDPAVHHPPLNASVALMLDAGSGSPDPLGMALSPPAPFPSQATHDALFNSLSEVYTWFRARAGVAPPDQPGHSIMVEALQTGAPLTPACPYAVCCVGAAPLHGALLLFLARIEPFTSPPPEPLLDLLREGWPVVTSLGVDTIGALSAKRRAYTERLSRCQREVLPMMLAGMTERQIAATIKRSPHTVHDHVKSVYALLGVASRVELLHLWNEV